MLVVDRIIERRALNGSSIARPGWLAGGPAILYPFPQVAPQIVQAESICFELCDS